MISTRELNCGPVLAVSLSMDAIKIMRCDGSVEKVIDNLTSTLPENIVKSNSFYKWRVCLFNICVDFMDALIMADITPLFCGYTHPANVIDPLIHVKL